MGMVEFTPGMAIPAVVTRRLPVATSTLAWTWSLIGNGKVVADGREPVRPVVVGPEGRAAEADCATPPTRAAHVTPTRAAFAANPRPRRVRTKVDNETPMSRDLTVNTPRPREGRNAGRKVDPKYAK